MWIELNILISKFIFTWSVIRLKTCPLHNFFFYSIHRFLPRKKTGKYIYTYTCTYNITNWYWGLILAINLLGTHFYFLFTFPSFIALTFSPNVSSFTFLSSLSCLTLSDLTVWWIWSLGKRNREPSTKFWWLS